MSSITAEPKRPGNPHGTPQTLIRDPHLRLQIHTQKQIKILHWLKTEIYSSSENSGSGTWPKSSPIAA